MTPPEPPPTREPVMKTVPAGTAIEVAFLDGLSSKASRTGDSFRARVAKDVMLDGIAVIPAGSVVVGSVTEAVPLKKIGGQAKLALEFNKLELTSGRSAPIDASFAEQGKSETGKDAATIGGAAAGGALLGRILSKNDKTKGTVLGAIVGAAAGTAVASKTKGQEVEIPAGTVITLKLDQAAQITVIP
jgi:outer membrane lipoprotein SlyB